jgi:hypothetical protein
LSPANPSNITTDNDVPTLPEWGLLMLASGLLLVVVKARKDLV